jgi:hypothetical protein
MASPFNFMKAKTTLSNAPTKKTDVLLWTAPRSLTYLNKESALKAISTYNDYLEINLAALSITIAPVGLITFADACNYIINLKCCSIRTDTALGTASYII